MGSGDSGCRPTRPRRGRTRGSGRWAARARSTRREAGGRWGTDVAAAAASAVAVLTGCLQATPRGLWGQSGPVAWATVQQWLGTELPDPPPSPVPFLLRYLAAFGPASIADMRTWSGWPRLRDVIDASGVQLRRFRSEHGRELLDLPDAPLMAPGLPAPIRFLPEYDNVHFAYQHRERINPHRFSMPRRPGNGAIMGTFLADGVFAGEWRRQRVSGPTDRNPHHRDLSRAERRTSASRRTRKGVRCSHSWFPTPKRLMSASPAADSRDEIPEVDVRSCRIRAIPLVVWMKAVTRTAPNTRRHPCPSTS